MEGERRPKSIDHVRTCVPATSATPNTLRDFGKRNLKVTSTELGFVSLDMEWSWAQK